MRPRRAGIAAVLLLAVCGAAPGAGAQEPARVEVRDSAGVTIVLNAARVPPQSWHVDPEPLVTLTAPEEDAFNGIVGAVRVGDGFAVGTASDGRVRFFDRRGRQVHVVGGLGQEPGEYQGMRSLVARGDSVAVWDADARRLTLLDARGRIVRVATLASGLTLSEFHGIFADGSFLLSDTFDDTEGEPGQVWRLSALYLRMNPDGTVRDTVGSFEDMEVYRFDEPGTDFRGLPFGRRTWVAAGPDAFYVAQGNGWEFTRHRPDGSVSLRVRRSHQPLPVPEADRAQWRRSIRRMASGLPDELRHEYEREAEKAPTADTYPPYERMDLAQDGRVWMQETVRYTELDRPGVYSVFDAGGRWIARVEGLEFFSVLQAGPDWVLGRAMGLYDEVRLHRLVRTPASEP